MTTALRKHAINYLLFFVGLSCMALGIALTTLASLGTTPISALPFVASLGFPASMGFFTVLLNMLLIVLQIGVLRRLQRKFPKEQYLQIPASIIFGSFIDFWMHVVPLPEVMTYGWSLLFLSLGILVVAFGVFVAVSADVVVMAGEGAVLVLSMLFHRDFGVIKTIFDTILVFLAVVLALLLFGELQGVREGTLLSAFLVGMIVKFFFSLKRSYHNARIR
jgi:uncharacterized membrane protein YczE